MIKEEMISKITVEKIKELNKVALDARSSSYVPYSRFAVGAALLSSDGSITKGINIENAAFTPGTCAERTAIYSAIANGKKDFLAISICGGEKGKKPNDYCPPCGVCRQVIREFADKNKFLIILCKTVDDYKIYTLEELLPLSFGPESMQE